MNICYDGWTSNTSILLTQLPNDIFHRIVVITMIKLRRRDYGLGSGRMSDKAVHCTGTPATKLYSVLWKVPSGILEAEINLTARCQSLAIEPTTRSEGLVQVSIIRPLSRVAKVSRLNQLFDTVQYVSCEDFIPGFRDTGWELVNLGDATPTITYTVATVPVVEDWLDLQFQLRARARDPDTTYSDILSHAEEGDQFVIWMTAKVCGAVHSTEHETHVSIDTRSSARTQKSKRRVYGSGSIYYVLLHAC